MKIIRLDNKDCLYDFDKVISTQVFRNSIITQAKLEGDECNYKYEYNHWTIKYRFKNGGVGEVYFDSRVKMIENHVGELLQQKRVSVEYYIDGKKTTKEKYDEIYEYEKREIEEVKTKKGAHIVEI